LEGGNGGRVVGTGRGRKLGCDCGAGGATSSDRWARDARGAHSSAVAASITSPTLRPVNLTASTETFPTSIINGTAMLG